MDNQVHAIEAVVIWPWSLTNDKTFIWYLTGQFSWCFRAYWIDFYPDDMESWPGPELDNTLLLTLVPRPLDVPSEVRGYLPPLGQIIAALLCLLCLLCRLSRGTRVSGVPQARVEQLLRSSESRRRRGDDVRDQREGRGERVQVWAYSAPRVKLTRARGARTTQVINDSHPIPSIFNPLFLWASAHGEIVFSPCQEMCYYRLTVRVMSGPTRLTRVTIHVSVINGGWCLRGQETIGCW